MCGCQIKQQIQQDLVLLLKCLGEYSIYSLPEINYPWLLSKLVLLGIKRRAKLP